MDIHINEEERMVELWLTQSEKGDKDFRAALRPFYESYVNRKYKIVFFLSGESELLSGCRDLLLHNRGLVVKEPLQN